MSKTVKKKVSSKTNKKRISLKISKTRRNYSYAQKNKILKDLDRSGDSVLAFSKKINIPTKTLQNWKQSKTKIYKLNRDDQKKKRLGLTRKPILKKR